MNEYITWNGEWYWLLLEPWKLTVYQEGEPLPPFGVRKASRRIEAPARLRNSCVLSSLLPFLESKRRTFQQRTARRYHVIHDDIEEIVNEILFLATRCTSTYASAHTCLLFSQKAWNDIFVTSLWILGGEKGTSRHWLVFNRSWPLRSSLSRAWPGPTTQSSSSTLVSSSLSGCWWVRLQYDMVNDIKGGVTTFKVRS